MCLWWLRLLLCWHHKLTGWVQHPAHSDSSSSKSTEPSAPLFLKHLLPHLYTSFFNIFYFNIMYMHVCLCGVICPRKSGGCVRSSRAGVTGVFVSFSGVLCRSRTPSSLLSPSSQLSWRHFSGFVDLNPSCLLCQGHGPDLSFRCLLSEGLKAEPWLTALVAERLVGWASAEMSEVPGATSAKRGRFNTHLRNAHGWGRHSQECHLCPAVQLSECKSAGL